MSGLTNAQADEAEQIKALMEESRSAMMNANARAIEAGERLVGAKKGCAHGAWLPFLERAGIHERQARRLMQLAKAGLKSDTVSDLGGIKAALEFVAKRTRATDLLKKVEFDGWAHVLDEAAKHGGHDGLTEHIDPRILHADMARLSEAMQIMQEMHDMLVEESGESASRIFDDLA